MTKKEPTPGLLLKHHDRLQLPGVKTERVKPEELDAIEKRADPKEIPRLVQEIRTLRSFIEMGRDALLLWENGQHPGAAKLYRPPGERDA